MSYLKPVDRETGAPLPVAQWDADTKRSVAMQIADAQRNNIAAKRAVDVEAIIFGRSLFSAEFKDLPSDAELKAKKN
jgi:hypothetical protein